MMLGPRALCDAVWEASEGPAPRLWRDQRLYLCETLDPGPRLPLRDALPSEVELVVEMERGLEVEDLGSDPTSLDDDVLHVGAARKIKERRVWLGERDGHVVFKVDLGLAFPEGALLGGTWVPHALRGRGVAAAGMREACARLLGRAPLVGLHVDEANGPARACYRSAGFHADAPFRFALAETHYIGARNER